MFDKLKQIKQMRDLQKQAQAEIIEAESNGVKIAIDGTLNLKDIKLNPDLNIEDQERAIMTAFRDGVSKVKSAMAQKFAGMI